MNNQVYLKPNVVIEPLVDSWYAWSHLISPATSALNIVERHLKIMESYISASEIHAEAVLNPMMRGGPFMDFNRNRVEDVKELRELTLKNCQHLLDLSKAIKDLDKILSDEAKGFGLEKLYSKVPQILQGYVELFYSRQNVADFRFFESFLYNSKFYDEGRQSIALWLTDNDQRPFCLSTPRLNDNDIIRLNIPFKSAVIDELARMAREPNDLSHISEILNLDPLSSKVQNLFTTSPPPVYNKYVGDHIRMRYFGHACIFIETRDISILVDPLISYYGYESDVQHYSFADLPDEIDYVLITHNHQDHVLFETLLPLRHKIKKIIVPSSRSGRLEDPDLRLMFNNIGFDNVFSIDEMATIDFEDAKITGIPFLGEHSDLNILSKACYLVSLGGFKLLFLADSRNIEPSLYKLVRNITGDVDVMFLGMECDGAPLSWLYGPLMPAKLPRDQDSSRRLSGSDYAKGMSLVEIFNPKEVYVYAMGQEPWVEFISSIKYSDESNPIIQSNMLVADCHKRGLIAERLFGEKELFYKKYSKL